MRKILSVLLGFILSISLSGCALLNVKMEENIDSTENAQSFYNNVDPTENAQSFYNKVNESKELLDIVATDVCAAWKDASYDYNLSTKDVNDAIEKAKNAHSDNIIKINELDNEICDLFDKAKDEMKNVSDEFALKRVMTTYSEYKDSILKANEALDTSGYVGVSVSKDSLDRALRELFTEL